MNNIKKLKVLLILVQKGKGDIIRSFLIKSGVSMLTNFFAEGFKKNYIMDILGNEKIEKLFLQLSAMKNIIQFITF